MVINMEDDEENRTTQRTDWGLIFILLFYLFLCGCIQCVAGAMIADLTR